LSRKRPADDAASENKRFKNAIEESAAEFLCPITQELPLDPVMAEDGHVYERTAIAEWLAKGNGKSPSTNELMGSKLLPALQVKNLISSMVKSGALSGDYVESWQQRIDEEQEVKETQDAAEAGDAAAMFRLGTWYQEGKKGLRKSELDTFRWYKSAAEKGIGRAQYYLGNMYKSGYGCTKNDSMAIYYYTKAAEKGSRGAAFSLSCLFEKAQLGLTMDCNMAAELMRKSLEPAADKHDTLSEKKRLIALNWLRWYDAEPRVLD